MSTATPLSANPRRNNGQQTQLRHAIPWLGAGLLVALIVAGLWPRPVLVEIARVATGPLRVTISEEGKTRITQRYIVAAPVTGYLRRITLKPGARISPDDASLAVIEPIPSTPLDARTRALTEARRDTATASLARAREAQKFAASELRRVERLFKDRLVSAQDFENVQARETNAARELTVAESTVRQVEAELLEFSAAPGTANPTRPPVEVRAPVSGHVLRVFEESARVVGAGTPLLEVGNPAALEAVIEALSRDGALVTPGMKVELEHWGGPRPLEARVRLVEPAAFTKISALGVEEQRVNVVVDLLTPPDERLSLGDNFRVEGRIVLWEEGRTLKVPSGALFRRGTEWAAFVLAGGKAQLRAIKTGRSSGSETQILAGIQEGDEVILYPGDRLKDGQRAKPMVIAPGR